MKAFVDSGKVVCARDVSYCQQKGCLNLPRCIDVDVIPWNSSTMRTVMAALDLLEAIIPKTIEALPAVIGSGVEINLAGEEKVLGIAN